MRRKKSSESFKLAGIAMYYYELSIVEKFSQRRIKYLTLTLVDDDKQVVNERE